VKKRDAAWLSNAARAARAAALVSAFGAADEQKCRESESNRRRYWNRDPVLFLPLCKPAFTFQKVFMRIKQTVIENKHGSARLTVII
jgi:hypothetical protein